MPDSVERILAWLEEAVLAGGEAIAHASPSASAKRTAKGQGDFSTAADEASEASICRVLRSKLPGVTLVTEEDASSHGNLNSRCLIVDPLDGTHIFGSGCEEWGITACYAEHGSVQAAVVAQPAQKRIFTAARGKGCYLNQEPFRIQAREAPHALVLALPLSHALSLMPFQRVISALQGANLIGTTRSLGCAVANTVEVLFGRVHAYLNLTGGKVWDLAACGLAVEEAGGEALSLDGKPLVWNTLSIPTVFAQSRIVSERLRSALRNADAPIG
jgi:myo-inositol-1(or 4)-monophosphatase